MWIKKVFQIVLVLALSVVCFIEFINLFSVEKVAEEERILGIVCYDIAKVSYLQTNIINEILYNSQNIEDVLNDYSANKSKNYSYYLNTRVNRNTALIEALQGSIKQISDTREQISDFNAEVYDFYNADLKQGEKTSSKTIELINRINKRIDSLSGNYFIGLSANIVEESIEIKVSAESMLNKYNIEADNHYKEYYKKREYRAAASKNIILAIIPLLLFGLDVKFNKKKNKI